MKARQAAERSVYTDGETGARVIQWTSASCKNHHLYFTSPSVTRDGRWLVFLSDRQGDPNLFAIDRRDGSILRLSDNNEGLLRSYVYPLGQTSGLSKASPCLDPERNNLYYIRNDRVYRVHLDDEATAETCLCELPLGWIGGYTHISPDGKTFCVPCTDPRAFADDKTQWEQLNRVPTRMGKHGLHSRLYFIDVQTGCMTVAAEVPFWVTHVQFDPMGSGRLIFNLEGHNEGIPLMNRIWCLELGGSFRPLAPEKEGEWRSHENWSPDGRSVIYHGFRDHQAFVAARTWDGQLLHETIIEGVEFWHATGMPDGTNMVMDCRDGMISLLNPLEPADGARVENLCRHDTGYVDQDAHAHPLVTPDGASVVFTSNRSGCCQVYEVEVPVKWRSGDMISHEDGNIEEEALK